ncbi:MAG: hypothetical protein WAW82_04370, partial [Candidatus Lutibacillus vidarii]
TNTGNVTVTGITVTDTFTAPAGPELTVTCPDTTLAPAASTTCIASYTVTQADVDNGSVVNSAVADGWAACVIPAKQDPAQPPATADELLCPVTSPASTATVLVTQTGALSLVKSADPVTVTAAGQSVTYSFLVTNTGNVTVSELTVADTLAAPAGPELTVTCPVTTLAPGASTTCAATYLVTQADVDHGRVDNTATASGMAPCPEGAAALTTCPVTSEPSSAEVTASATAAISLDKQATAPQDRNNDGYADTGDVIEYTFIVTNTGTTTLTDVRVDDPMLGAVTCPVTTLAPGESTTCGPVAYTVTAADTAAGTLVNHATATGTPPDGVTPPSAEDETSTELTAPLPHTGADVGDWAQRAALLGLIGVGLLLGSRRRRYEGAHSA